MSDTVEIAPLAEVREVVETFRHHGLVLPDWPDSVRSAIRALTEAVHAPLPDAATRELVAELSQLLDHGLASDPALLDHLAVETAELLASVRPPGVPAPNDENWAFPGDPTSA